MKKFISFSGGVESTTMCILFGNKADAVFSDTGFEHNLVYNQIDKVEEWCKKFHRPDFKIHKIKAAAKLHGKVFDSLPEYILEARFYPSFKTRYCTGEFKIKPIDNFLEQFKKNGVELMIGLNADEIEQRTGNHGNKKFIKYSYPLADNNINRDMCYVILNRTGLNPNYPIYMKRGGCIGCYYKNVSQYKALYSFNPDEFNQVENLENKLNELKKKENGKSGFYRILGGIDKPSMSEIRKMVDSEMFNREEVYTTINDATKCGVFCNR